MRGEDVQVGCTVVHAFWPLMWWKVVRIERRIAEAPEIVSAVHVSGPIHHQFRKWGTDLATGSGGLCYRDSPDLRLVTASDISMPEGL